MAKKKSTKKQAAPTTQDLSFEQAMEDLEGIVLRMEQGGDSLESALDDYGVAIQLMKVCHQKLEKAERRIEILTGVDADGNPITDEFRDSDESLDEKRQSRSSRRTAADNRKTDRKEEDESSLF